MKIFTKCLTSRLKPLITNLSHEHQFAKPGKQIFFIANLLRDLWWDASDSKIDAYFVLLDFKTLGATINNDTRIEGLGKGRKRNVKCPSYADDLTLALVGCPSVCLAFEIMQRFFEATGLKLNMEKTQGIMVGSSCTDDRLPSINCQNQSIKIVGFEIGNVNPRKIWHNNLEGLKKQKLLNIMCPSRLGKPNR